MGKRRKKKRAAGAQEAPLKAFSTQNQSVDSPSEGFGGECGNQPTNRNQLDVVSARLLAFAEKMGLVKQ